MLPTLSSPSRSHSPSSLPSRSRSKSGSSTNPSPSESTIEKYGLDAVRYYLVREVVFGSDGTFTPEQFVERVNIDLANDFGNLLSRTVSMISKYFGGSIPEYVGCKNEFDEDLERQARHSIEQYEKNMESLHVTEAFVEVFNYISRANKYIEETKPWALAKDETKQEELKSVMNHLANALRQSAIMLQPVLLKAPKELFAQLGVEEELQQYSSLGKVDAMGGQIVNKGNPLFPRLDANVEIEYIKSLMGGNK